MKIAIWISATALSVLLAGPACAQIGPALDPGLMIGYTGAAAVHYDNERRQRASARPPSTRNLKLQASRPDVAVPSAAALSYQPSAAVRKRNFAQFVERARAVDPDGAGKLETLLNSMNVIGEVQKKIGHYGMRTDNLADALAVYLASAWFAIRASTDDPTPAQMRGLRNQVARAIGASPEFARASDAMKQQLAEANLIQAVIISGYAETAKAKPALRAQIASAVAKGARQSYGLDLRAMSLSGRGLQPD